MGKHKEQIRYFVSRQPQWFLVLYASLAAFLTYSCMYAFRKPFTICEYEGFRMAGADYKLWLITAQVVGYTLSKFIGINYIAELRSEKRALSVILLIAFAELALFLFYIIPPPFNCICMFFNGLPLGIIWGIVFSYLEGRRVTEVLGAALSASFIIASGVVKSAGVLVMQFLHVNEFAMPFVTGLFFIFPLVISLYFLDCIPVPTLQDEKNRTKREPMDKTSRKAFIKAFLPGIILLVTTYVFLTIFRELRDNFAAELWKSIGYTNNSAIFTQAEIPVAVFTIVSLAMVVFIHNNFKALQVILYLITVGFFLVFIAALLYRTHLINGTLWMIATGTGLYLGYVPFNAFLYERLISAFQIAGNIGFIMYVSDAFGYLGSLGVVFMKNFASPSVSWNAFFVEAGIWLSLTGIFLVLVTSIYFRKKFFSSQYTNRYEYKHITRKPLFAFNARTTIDKQNR
jgi:hypothetical protein